MTLYRWDKTTPGNNATADATINWAEGQAPSSVNDSARGMMTAVAKYRDDIAGRITTAGTSTAYTVTSNQVFDTLAHMDGAMLGFVPHTTCGATVTLNVDSLGAKPLRSAPGVELSAGALISGTPYVASYNNSSGVWYLQGFADLSGTIPIGSIVPFAGSTAPNANYALTFGQAISRATYATLFALTSTTFGIGDGSTTFNIPDLRGRTPFGLDNLGGSAASRIGTVVTDSGTITGTTLGSAGGSSTHALITAELPVHSHTITDPTHFHNMSTSSIGAGGGGFGTFAFGSGTGTQTAAASTGITGTNNAGSGTAHAILPPAIMLGFIIRVL